MKHSYDVQTNFSFQEQYKNKFEELEEERVANKRIVEEQIRPNECGIDKTIKNWLTEEVEKALISTILT